LLHVVTVPAETEKVELEFFGERVVLQQVLEACAKVMRHPVLALTHLADDTAGDGKGVFEFCAVALVQVTKAPEPFDSQMPFNASSAV